MRRFLPPLGASLSGLCLYASFAPWRQWPLAFVGVALLVAVLRGRGVRGAFGLGFLSGMTFFGLLVDWATEATGTWVARAGLGAALALYVGGLGVVWRGLVGRFGQRPWLLAPSLATTWVAMEQLRGAWPFGGMPWGTLAFGQVEGPLLRLAPYGSTQAVGFAVVAIGVLLEAATKRANRLSALACAAAAATAAFGPAFLPVPTRSQGTLTVAFVQGRIPSKDELPAGVSRALTVTRNLAEQTRSVEGRGADVVLWPESASDLDAAADPDARTIVEGASERLGVPLLLGTQRYPEDYRYNDYVVWTPDRGPVDRYTKLHPVAFGEYIPARGFFRKFSSAVDQVSVDMRAGQGPAVVDVPVGERDLRIAVPICFEVAYGQIVREAVAEGAQLLVVPTNNASFGLSAESRQQFDMTRFRAVETGRTAIQVSTVGVSGIVGPNGVVRELTTPWQADARVAKVGLRSDVTAATRLGGPLTSAFYVAGIALVGLALVHGPGARGGTKGREGGR